MMRFGIPEYRLPRTLLRGGDRQDRLARRGPAARYARSSPAFGLAELRAQGFEAVFLSVGVSRGPRPAGAGRRARRRRQGGRLPAERQPRLPHGPRPARRGDRRRLRGLRRRADGAAPGREAETVERDRAETDARVKEALDSARAAIRGGATEVTDRLARELRRDARAAHDAGTRGVRGGEARRRPFRHAPRAQAVPRRRPPRARSSCGRCARSSTTSGRFAPALRRRRRLDARSRRLHPGDRPEAPTSSFLNAADGVALTPAARSASIPRRSPPRRRASSPAATSRSVRAT